MISPGLVDAKTIRAKLNKQLKIELEPHEKIHLVPNRILAADLDAMQDTRSSSGLAERHKPKDPNAVYERIIQERLGSDIDEPCQVEIRELGAYVARISLRGGHSIPLRVQVLKR